MPVVRLICACCKRADIWSGVDAVRLSFPKPRCRGGICESSVLVLGRILLYIEIFADLHAPHGSCEQSAEFRCHSLGC